MSVAVENYSYDDYKNWEGDWELIEGYPVAMAPSPMKIHQNISAEFIFEIKKQLEDKEDCEECEVLAEMDYKISDDTVVRPDIVLTCGEEGEYYLTKAPKIIVEIISKATARRDEKVKFELYEREKVAYYIIVYPDDLVAKLYKIRDSKYDKVGDMTKEIYTFDDLECELSIDFNNIFKRFRATSK